METNIYRCVRCGQRFSDLAVFLAHDHGLGEREMEQRQRAAWVEFSEGVEVLILSGEAKQPLHVKIRGFVDSLYASSPMYASLPGRRQGRWLKEEIQITREQVVALVNEEPEK